MRLIDADALKKRMVNEPVKAVQDVDFQAEWFTRIADTVCHMIDMVDDSPTVPAASRWVRCEDELPKRGRLVLAYRGPIAMISAMYTDGCGWRDADLFPMQGVTHWMPLPEPPKEDA